MKSIKTIQSVTNALSTARISTYENAVGNTLDSSSALELYAWNAQVSGALLTPLHICEVVIRNAVSDALTSVYGDRWAWQQGFERSLKNKGKYNPRQDLLRTRSNIQTIGKLIPEMKFVFWQKMFISHHDGRLWNQHLMQIFPNLDSTKSIAQLRTDIYNELEEIRTLRNRIAHHEPIFTRNLENDFQKIINLVRFRCSSTADWLLINQQALALIQSKPIKKSPAFTMRERLIKRRCKNLTSCVYGRLSVRNLRK